MQDFAIAWDWLSFAVRWLHVVTAIAWIGSSFYFIALDLGLRQRPGLPAGAHGEEWQVHGGGFYHIQKYLVAPAEMPEHLTWFKWESYMTWLSGFAMLAIVYYAGADLFLIDPNVLDVSVPVGINCRVVRLNSRTPRCFSSSLMRLEATAGEMRMSRPAADRLPSSTTRTKTAMLSR